LLVNETFRGNRITIIYHRIVSNLQLPSRELIIEYSIIYDVLHTMKYNRIRYQPNEWDVFYNSRL